MLAFYTKVQRYQDTTGAFHIRKMIEGWYKEWAGARDTHTPISPDIISKVRRSMGYGALRSL